MQQVKVPGIYKTEHAPHHERSLIDVQVSRCEFCESIDCQKCDDGCHSQKIFFLTHPMGNRWMRRARQQHSPKFTKSVHKGREWFRMEYEQ